jgi:hypothetical protein
MSLTVKIRNAETGSSVDMEMENENTMDEIVKGAAGFWNKEPGAYVLRRGKKLLRGSQTVLEVGLKDDDELELIPDPEGGYHDPSD